MVENIWKHTSHWDYHRICVFCSTAASSLDFRDKRYYRLWRRISFSARKIMSPYYGLVRIHGEIHCHRYHANGSGIYHRYGSLCIPTNISLCFPVYPLARHRNRSYRRAKIRSFPGEKWLLKLTFSLELTDII